MCCQEDKQTPTSVYRFEWIPISDLEECSLVPKEAIEVIKKETNCFFLDNLVPVLYFQLAMNNISFITLITWWELV